MYLKKVNGPRLVALPDGTSLSLADLPKEGTKRWVASRKAVVAKAVKFGLIKPAEAMSRYDLSEEELQSWIGAIERHGTSGLKVTRMQALRSSR